MRILPLNCNSRSVASKNRLTHLLLLLSFSCFVCSNTATAQLTDSLILHQLTVFHESENIQDLNLLRDSIYQSNFFRHDFKEIMRDYLRLIEVCRNTIDSPRFTDNKPFTQVRVPIWLFPDKVFSQQYPAGIDPDMITDAELRTAYLVEIEKNNLRFENARFIREVNLFIVERAAEFDWRLLELKKRNSMTLDQALLMIEQSNLKEEDRQDLITRIQNNLNPFPSYYPNTLEGALLHMLRNDEETGYIKEIYAQKPEMTHRIINQELLEGDRHVQERAIRLVAACGDFDLYTTESLMYLRDSASVLIREQFMRSLRVLRTEERSSLLLKALSDDPSQGVRYEALGTIKDVLPEECIPPLKNLLADQQFLNQNSNYFTQKLASTLDRLKRYHRNDRARKKLILEELSNVNKGDYWWGGRAVMRQPNPSEYLKDIIELSSPFDITETNGIDLVLLLIRYSLKDPLLTPKEIYYRKSIGAPMKWWY